MTSRLSVLWAAALLATSCRSSGGETPREDPCDRCDAAAGESCVAEVCVTPCERAALEPSSVGCEFWAVDLDLFDPMSDFASEAWGVAIVNPGVLPASVVITRNDAAPGADLQVAAVAEAVVPPGEARVVTLPTRELDCGAAPNQVSAPGTCLSSRAYRLVASMPVTVSQLNPLTSSFSNDGSLLLPTSALGRAYRALGWPAGHPVPITLPGIGTFQDRAYLTVVGTQPATQVTIDAMWRVKGNPPIDAIATGGRLSVTLGAFDVLNLETDDATLQEAAGGDLSGTRVTASAPVAVFSGTESAVAPGGSITIPTFPGWESDCCADHLEEQLLPLEVGGTRWILPRSPVRSTGAWHEPDLVRFVGGEEPAQVVTSLAPPFNAFTLQPGQILTAWTQTAAVVTATRPIVVGQVLASQGYVEGAGLGDPSLALVVPVEQLLADYRFMLPPSWSEGFAVVTAPAGADLELDGAAPAGCTVEQAGMLDGVQWESRACPVTPGTHRLLGDTPFGAVVYAYGSAGSLALPAGAGAAPLYVAPAH